ncbi:MAG: phasin family protein, partial [Pseudomonadota bacterium]
SFDPSAMMAANQSGLKHMADVHQQMMKRMADMNVEVTRFYTKRFDEDRKVFHELTQCKNPQEAITVWGAFMEQAAKDYAEEMGNIATLCATQAKATMDDVTDAVEDVAAVEMGARKA